MSSIIDIKYVLTQRAHDVLCHKYYIPEEVHLELPHPGATMHQRPTGKIRLSRNYTLDEDIYPKFEHRNREGKMDLSVFIHVLDPTKVKTIEREHAEGEAKLLETIVGHTVSLLLIVLAHAEEELEASIDRIFSEDVSREQADSAKVGTAAIEQTVTAADTVVENVAIKKTKRQKKKRYAATDAGEASHPAKKLRSDHGTVSRSTTGGKSPSVLKRLLVSVVLNAKVGIAVVPILPFITTSISTTPKHDVHNHTDSISGLNLCNVEPSKRFVVISDSSHHSCTYAIDAEVESCTRSLTPSILVMTNVTTTTTVVDPISATKEKPAEPFLFLAGSHSTSGVGSFVGGFSDLCGSDFLMGYIRTIMDMVDEFAPPHFFALVPGMKHVQLFTEFNVGAVCQTCLSAEVRMHTEYNIREKRRLSTECEQQKGLMGKKHEEIASLQAQLLLKEAEAAEAIRLHSQAYALKVAEKSPWEEMDVQKEHNSALEKERDSLDAKVME
ncbi:hypothetical protein Tco_0529753 [Tanacetum coccineum]